VTSSDSASSAHYYLDDHPGTTQMELSPGGWPVWQGQFTPFGQEIVNGAPLLPGQADGSSMHYKFTGKERDAESGLDYFGARYYASSVGRWMSPDPMQVSQKHLMYPQRWNAYSYVRNQPLIAFDPDGLDDFYIFRPTATATSPGWQKAAADAEAHGNHLHFYNAKEATAEAMNKVIGTPGAHVVYAGHADSPEDGAAPREILPMGSTSLTTPRFDGAPLSSDDGSSGTAVGITGVNASSVGIFGCDSADFAVYFGGTNFTGLNSGTDRLTDLSTIDAAALAYTSSLSTGQSLDQATAKANEQVKKSTFKSDKDGDKVYSVPKQKPR